MPNNLPYDHSYRPPAIVSDFEVKFLAATASVRMIVDTGADMSCVPSPTIDALAAQLKVHLPYSMIEVEDFNGKKSKRRAYELETQKDSFGSGNSFTFVVIDDEVGIIGRDLLNGHKIELDGPSRFWHFFS